MQKITLRVCFTGLWWVCSALLQGQTPAFTAYPTTFPVAPESITAGPDGALWFTEGNATTTTIGRITTTGAITSYVAGTVLPSGSNSIVTGPDGALWFTTTNAVNRFTTSGEFTSYPVTGPSYKTSVPELGNIVVGPDGALWFTSSSGGFSNQGNGFIGRITTSGNITTYDVPLGHAFTFAFNITPGPDGNLWFTQAASVGMITPSGVITEYPGPCYSNSTIVAGSDGALWFSPANDGATQAIGRITTSGVFSTFPVGDTVAPGRITAGPDGALWFAHGVPTGGGEGAVGRMTTAGVETDYVFQYAMSTAPGITTGPDGAIWFTDYNGEIVQLALPQTDGFFTGQQLVATGIYYLQFENGTPLGYYAFTAGSASTATAWMYHFDLGFLSEKCNCG